MIMQDMQIPLLSVKQIEKYYKTDKILTKALNKISFEVQRGEFIGIMGASGSGKTTMLNCLATIDKVSTGSIQLNGEDITRLDENNLAAFRCEHLGFIFQDFNLLDTLTIEENIALPLVIKKISAKEVDYLVHSIAVELEINDILKKFPYQVSGGQKQRGAFARAVIGSPDLIMADEPTGALDSNSAKNLLKMMLRWNEKLHTTIFMVTHDPLCASYTNRIMFLKDGEIFDEILKGKGNQIEFYNKILDVLSELGEFRTC